MEEKNSRGGRRKGAGRKPIDNPKQPITLFIPKKDIWVFGSIDKLKNELYEFISQKRNEKSISIQDSNETTPIVEPINNLKTNYTINTETVPANNIIGNFDKLKEEIAQTATIPEIEKVMQKVKTELLPLKQKLQLESIAKEHSKNFYMD